MGTWAVFAVDGKAGTWLHRSTYHESKPNHAKLNDIKWYALELTNGAWLTVERINSQDADPLSMMVHTSDLQSQSMSKPSTWQGENPKDWGDWLLLLLVARSICSFHRPAHKFMSKMRQDLEGAHRQWLYRSMFRHGLATFFLDGIWLSHRSRDLFNFAVDGLEDFAFLSFSNIFYLNCIPFSTSSTMLHLHCALGSACSGSILVAGFFDSVLSEYVKIVAIQRPQDVNDLSSF